MDTEFLRIFDMYKNDVYRFSYSYTKNTNSSDDITQNVFLKLYKNKKILEQEDVNIKKWLIKVTLNECKTLFLSSWYKKITLFNNGEEERFSALDSNNDVLELILKLPKKSRLVIFLYYYHGYKISEISKQLKTSETNIQTILYRSRKELKRYLKEDK